MILTRKYLMDKLAAMPPNARGRKELERLLKTLTTAALQPARVKAVSRPAHANMEGRG